MKFSPFATSVLEQLRTLDSCTVSNAVESFGVRLRNAGFTDSTVHCIFPALPPVVGYGVTCRMRSASPPMEGHNYCDRTDWWTHILSVPAPRIAVLEDIDERRGLGSLVGEIHANILKALGCIAVVTNGAVRDLAAAQSIQLQMFAQNVSVSHAYAHIVDFGGPVIIGGMKVETGDLLHGDAHGVLTVPAEIAEKIPDAAREIRRREERIVAFCRGTEFTPDNLDKLHEAVKDWN